MTMSHRERLGAAMRGAEVDRVPVALWRHFPRADETAEGLAEAVIAFQDAYDFDLVKVTPASGYPAEAWGAELEAADNEEGTRSYLRRVVREPADWRRLEPIATDAPALARELRAIELVRRGVGEDVHVFQTVFSPLTIAKQLAGREAMLAHLDGNPADLHAGLTAIAETTALFAAACLRAGADGIFFATQFACRDVPGEEAYGAFGEPYDQIVLEAVHGARALLLLHLCGEDPIFEVADRYGADIVNWHDQGTPPTLAEAQRLWRGGAVLGGLDRDVLAAGDPADARAMVASAISAAGGRRLVVGAGCVTLVTTPPGAIRAVRRAVEPD